MLKRKLSSSAPICSHHSCAGWHYSLRSPSVYLAVFLWGSPLCVRSSGGFICTWMVCGAMQSCSVPGFGCSRSICACNALHPRGKAGLSWHWAGQPPCPGRVYSLSPPAARRLRRKGMQLSCSDVKVLLANYAIICIPGAMPPWFMDMASLTQGFKKPSPASAGPGCRSTRCLDGFQTPLASAVAGRNAGQVTPSTSAVTHLRSVGLLQIQSQHLLVSVAAGAWRSCGKGFLLHWGSSIASHPCSKWALLSVESCCILNLLLSHRMHLPSAGGHAVYGQSWSKT